MWVRPNTSRRRPQYAGLHPIHFLGTDTGCFQVTFQGPGQNVERLRVPDSRFLVTPSIEARLNDRQKRILTHVLETGSVTSGWCLKEFGIVYNTAYRDFDAMVNLGVLRWEGRGRGTHYTMEAPKR